MIINLPFSILKQKGQNSLDLRTNINNKKFVFLGDETLNIELYDLVKNADYVTHEAFCLDSEEHIFHAYEKNHSTVKSVCEIMNKLNVKNLILYHTEESHGEDRKNLYFNEGSKYYNGNSFNSKWYGNYWNYVIFDISSFLQMFIPTKNSIYLWDL